AAPGRSSGMTSPLRRTSRRVRLLGPGALQELESAEGQLADLGVTELVARSVLDPPLVGEEAADLVPREPLEPHLGRLDAETLLVRVRHQVGEAATLLPPGAVRRVPGIPPALGLQAVGDGPAPRGDPPASGGVEQDEEVDQVAREGVLRIER